MVAAGMGEGLNALIPGVSPKRKKRHTGRKAVSCVFPLSNWWDVVLADTISALQAAKRMADEKERKEMVHHSICSLDATSSSNIVGHAGMYILGGPAPQDAIPIAGHATVEETLHQE